MKTQTSLYDFFSMVIPGFLLLLLVSYGQWNFTIAGHNADSIVGGTLLFIASYTIGLLYHKVIERITSPILRNNKCCIKKQWKKFRKKYKDNGETKLKKSKEGNLQEYYTAYYALMKENMLGNIPVLEAQVAFLRNTAPITLLYVVAICCCNSSFLSFANPCCLAIVLLILLVGMVMALLSIQNKVYYLVWEGYEYLP